MSIRLSQSSNFAAAPASPSIHRHLEQLLGPPPNKFMSPPLPTKAANMQLLCFTHLKHSCSDQNGSLRCLCLGSYLRSGVTEIFCAWQPHRAQAELRGQAKLASPLTSQTILSYALALLLLLVM